MTSTTTRETTTTGIIMSLFWSLLPVQCYT